MGHFILIIAALATSVTAKDCMNLTVPVTISSRNGVFNNYATPETNVDATAFVSNLTRQGQNATADALTGYATISGTYHISAQYCQPSSGSKKSIIQVLTHGIGFDKTYWDIAYNDFNYSYVNVATNEYGYDTLIYDRLGIGLSSHGDPKNEIQAFLEIAALAEMTAMLRNGTILGIKRYSKVVHVGHSFGSTQTYSLTNKFPTLSDAIVLTGFSPAAQFVPLFGAGADFQQANLNQPLRFGNPTTAAAISSVLKEDVCLSDPVVQMYDLTDVFARPVDGTAPLNYPNGYLTNSNVDSLQYLFLLAPFFDPGLAYYGEAGKQPVTPGELLTLGSIPQSSAFSGPVLVFTGSNDLPFCGGDCLNTGGLAAPSIPALAVEAFPSAKSFEAYIQPQTGHGLTMHYNATAGYRYINEWIDSQGL